MIIMNEAQKRQAVKEEYLKTQIILGNVITKAQYDKEAALNKAYVAELEKQIVDVSGREGYHIERATFWSKSSGYWSGACTRWSNMAIERRGEIADLTTELQQAEERIATLKAELNAANETLLATVSGRDMLLIETMMAYNLDIAD